MSSLHEHALERAVAVAALIVLNTPQLTDLPHRATELPSAAAAEGGCQGEHTSKCTHAAPQAPLRYL
jgi:hypothetical protein